MQTVVKEFWGAVKDSPEVELDLPGIGKIKAERGREGPRGAEREKPGQGEWRLLVETFFFKGMGVFLGKTIFWWQAKSSGFSWLMCSTWLFVGKMFCTLDCCGLVAGSQNLKCCSHSKVNQEGADESKGDGESAG